MNEPLLSLLHLSDPNLPIGGYAHSAGLETYVQQGIVHNSTTARSFITEMLTRNLAHNDAAYVSLAFDAAGQEDLPAILRMDEECSALKIPAELRQASRKLAIRLVKIFQSLVKNNIADAYRSRIETKGATGHYCIAWGIFASAMAIDKESALTGFYYNMAAGMVTNCVKLVPLGQQDGQQILFELQPLIQQLAKDTMVPDKDLLGRCCTGFDIRCMQHEQLYSRLYMS